MLRYEYYYEDDNKDDCEIQKDACDVSEEQRAFVTALGLRNACVHVGK